MIGGAATASGYRGAATASGTQGAAAASGMEWEPIETAPKDSTPIDLWRPLHGGERLTNMRRVSIGETNIFYEPVEFGESCVRDATHWMSLPEPPKE